MESFIEGVRMQPCLWNPLHPDYREFYMKDEAWQRVVDHYNDKSIPNIQVAKLEWKKLRDNHRDALKRAKLGKNKLLPAQITTWKYAKIMQFLEPHMKYRITENIEMDPPAGPSVKSFDHDVSTTDTSISENMLTEIPTNKRRCIDHATSSPTATRLRHDTDALESFFNCILKSTRDMPQWMQTQVKKKIFAVIIEAEEYLSSQEPNNSKEKFNDLPTDNKIIKTEIFTEDSSDNNYS